MKALRPILVRADASSQIGTGHVMRCIALGQAWQDRGNSVAFLSTFLPEALEARVHREGFSVHRTNSEAGSRADAIDTIAVAQQLGAQWVVTDGYHFDAAYQDTIRNAGLRLLFIDDNAHASRYSADIVLNQNIYAAESMYAHRSPETRLLLGTRYCLLRREFLALREAHHPQPEIARNILVTMGGSDEPNVTGKVIQALRELGEDFHARVIVGPANPHLDDLRLQVQGAESKIELVTEPPDMPAMMLWADIAISAAGTTAWELLYMRVPSLVFAIAGNQDRIADELLRYQTEAGITGMAVSSLGEVTSSAGALLTRQDFRCRMASIGRWLVDGLGGDRVVHIIEGARVFVRSAETFDAELIWHWANDPITRSVSFSSDPIPLDRHLEWFRHKMEEPSCIFYIIENNSAEPIGQVRFDNRVSNDGVDISIAVAPPSRGMGYGTEILSAAISKLFHDSAIRMIHAYVKPSNGPSLKIFEKAGFTRIGTCKIREQEAVHFILNRENDR